MGFIPETAVEPSAVFGSLRVMMENNLQKGERLTDVLLDTMSDLTHQSAVFADAGLVSAARLQQSLAASRNYQDAWSALADYGARLRDSYFTFMNECLACRSRAFERLNLGNRIPNA
ncbi:MAG: hypothetical protein KF794_05565 [Xanthobacteraceae bacterium]|nr:hypothetical protein [Xanthobacteraceae bacterium]QYK46157.1 MAG: hypothetical protein KF794_05565 [Xanthobacteraceae bacterium]